MPTQSSGNLDIGAVFERVLSTYAKTWRTLMLGALIVFAPIALLVGLIIASESAGAAFLAFAATIIGTFWYQGMVVETVRDVQDGTLDSSVGQLFRSVTPVLGTLIGAGFLAVLGLMVGFILLIIPGLILLTIWAVLAPVIVIERKGAIEAFGRSRELVRGNGWQVFGVLVALFALNIVLSIFVSLIAAASDGAGVVAQLLQYLILAPVSALAAAIIYFALREAHGDAALQQPTGVLTGGFAPPVAPEPQGGQTGWPAQQPPDTTTTAAFEPPSAPSPGGDAPAAGGQPSPEEPAHAESAPGEPEESAMGEPAESALGAPAEPAPGVPEESAMGYSPEPAPEEPAPEEPAPSSLDNAPAENAFGTPPPAGSDAFGQPEEEREEPPPPPPPATPREPGQSIPPPGWKPPSGG